MMAPLTLRYMMAEDSEHPHCQQVMLCELNTKVKQRFGKPGEIAMQLARYFRHSTFLLLLLLKLI